MSIVQQIVKVIDFWHKSIDSSSLYNRSVLSDIKYDGKEIIDFVGPRRSGKSSVLKLIIRHLNLKENYLFINFEDPFFVSYNESGIIEEIIAVYRDFFSPKLKYLFFDEIQQINQWERVIRKFRDIEEYKIFLTGSSSKLLSGEISSLLTGRHLSYHVLPLSFKEFLVFRGIHLQTKKDVLLKEKVLLKELSVYMGSGGFPEAVLTQSQEILKNYFFDILQRDIVMRHDVRGKDILQRMAVFLLSNTGKITSIESLKNIFNISFTLASAYIEYLKDAFMVFELPLFSYSLKKQSKALKKFYSIDVGLSNAVSFRFSEDKGRVLENIVFLELKKRNKEIYYYKTSGNLEVDFLIKEKNEVRELIQVTWNLEDKKTKQREIKAVFHAMDELQIRKGFILTNEGEETIQEGDREIIVKPVYKWLLEI